MHGKGEGQDQGDAERCRQARYGTEDHTEEDTGGQQQEQHRLLYKISQSRKKSSHLFLLSIFMDQPSAAAGRLWIFRFKWFCLVAAFSGSGRRRCRPLPERCALFPPGDPGCRDRLTAVSHSGS